MEDVATIGSMVSGMWLSIALLAAGHARGRNRLPWFWFLFTAFLGPISVFLLVVWPALPAAEQLQMSGACRY